MRSLPLLLLVACAQSVEAPVTVDAPVAIDRLAFNERAITRGVPVFMRGDGSVVGYRSTLPFDGDVEAAKARVLADEPVPERPADEVRRREAVRKELLSGRVTLIETEVHGSVDAAMIGHLLLAADAIEALFALQTGAAALKGQVPADDPASAALFWRNQGPWCESPGATPDCAAVPGAPPKIAGIYPADVQVPGFCDTLPRDVLAPFVVAEPGPSGLVAVPYTERWPAETKAVADHLTAAAEAAPDDEPALEAYLRAAASAFGTNDWFAADAAWARMNPANSRWYLRVGPDETYWDPCNEHAGFHMVLARVDPEGLRLQAMLEPVKQEMEAALATLSGPPYAAREVGFELPEFVQIVLNAGDARAPTGGTIGQSLPNWGPVAEAGGRTVAMTNINSDPDSVAANESALSSLFCTATLAAWPREPGPLRFSTVLHEAGHNLGPSHEYRVDGQTDVERFGGSLATLMEELKAQTVALYLDDWLATKGVIDPKEVAPTHMADVAWAVQKVSEGMRAPDGSDRHYPQLAAIQVGYLIDHGALAWKGEPAANGVDPGCLEVDAAALPGAIDAMSREVLGIKARGDKEAALALKARYVDGDGVPAALRRAAEERYRRVPRPSNVYRVAFLP